MHRLAHARACARHMRCRLTSDRLSVSARARAWSRNPLTRSGDKAASARTFFFFTSTFADRSSDDDGGGGDGGGYGGDSGGDGEGAKPVRAVSRASLRREAWRLGSAVLSASSKLDDY